MPVSGQFAGLEIGQETLDTVAGDGHAAVGSHPRDADSNCPAASIHDRASALEGKERHGTLEQDGKVVRSVADVRAASSNRACLFSQRQSRPPAPVTKPLTDLSLPAFYSKLPFTTALRVYWCWATVLLEM